MFIFGGMVSGLLFIVLIKMISRKQDKKITHLSTHEVDDKKIKIVDVMFEGYPGSFKYEVKGIEVVKGNYVLVLTHDGIRCGKVVSQPMQLTEQTMNYPLFLLQPVLCVAEADDIAYYNEFSTALS